MAYHQHYRSPFGDTTFTKVFVGGLAWETPTDVMRAYFEQFGHILEAVIITDKNTSKSKGYGFVTFRDAESARRACAEPNPVIDGRRANCNIASLGRPRPSPPPGRSQGGSPYHGAAPQGASSSYSGMAAPIAPPVPPPPPPVIYPPYGYATYPPDYGYQQNIYNSQLQQGQYYQQPYGMASAAAMGGGAYYYGYSMQQPTRGTFSGATGQRIIPPHSSYLYYPPHPLTPTDHHHHHHPLEGQSFSTFQPPPSTLLHSTSHHPFTPFSDPQISQQTSTETEARAVTSESPSTST